MGGRRGRAGARRPAGHHGLRLWLFLAVLPSVLLGAGSPGVGGLSPAARPGRSPAGGGRPRLGPLWETRPSPPAARSEGQLRDEEARHQSRDRG